MEYYEMIARLLKWQSFDLLRPFWAVVTQYNDHQIYCIFSTRNIEVCKNSTVLIRVPYTIPFDNNIYPVILQRIDEGNYDMRDM